MPLRREVLIATLGTQPEVVTVTLDLLLDRGCNIEEVVVIHTSPSHPQIREALQRLDAEFPNGTLYAHANRPCRYRKLELRVEGRPILDITTEGEAGAVFTAVYREVREQKKQGSLVHLCIAGGRKSMSVYGMATAQLLFDADDRLWHLFSTKRFEEQDLMHPTSPKDAQLVPIPLLPYRALSIPLATLLVTDDPIQAIEEQRNLIRMEERRKQREFIEEILSSPERRIVEAMMEEILVHHHSPTNEEIGRKIYLSPSTVGNAFTRIYEKLHAFLGLPDDVKVDRALLVALFSSYFAEKFRE